MKRFNTFGEYMFDLLFGPLKKGKKTVNQFFIFFKVVGRIFDGMKMDIFRVRDEANVATASPIMLPVHGQDRGMPRLIGEEIEDYRTRLSMKGLIAEWGGTKTGILYSLTALGYPNSRITPVILQNPESDRWAEFTIWLADDRQVGLQEIASEVNRVKAASSKANYGIQSSFVNRGASGFPSLTVCTSISSYNMDGIYLNGQKNLDGSWLLDSISRGIVFTVLKLTVGVMIEQSISAAVTVDTLWTLDGARSLDGSRQLNADKVRSEI